VTDQAVEVISNRAEGLGFSPNVLLIRKMRRYFQEFPNRCEKISNGVFISYPIITLINRSTLGLVTQFFSVSLKRLRINPDI
jgi:hypothetical protein